MTRILLDTDVFSYFLRRDSRAERFRPFLAGREIVVSFQTVAELYRGAYERNWGELRMARLHRMLAATTVTPATVQVSLRWARVMADSRRAGRPMGIQDAWIAATALIHGLPLLTNNRRDFEHIQGLSLPAPDQ